MCAKHTAHKKEIPHSRDLFLCADKSLSDMRRVCLSFDFLGLIFDHETDQNQAELEKH